MAPKQSTLKRPASETTCQNTDEQQISEGSVVVTKPVQGDQSRAFGFLERFQPGMTLSKKDHNDIASILASLERQGKQAKVRWSEVSKIPEQRDDFLMELRLDPTGSKLKVKDKRSITIDRQQKITEDWHSLWEVGNNCTFVLLRCVSFNHISCKSSSTQHQHWHHKQRHQTTMSVIIITRVRRRW